MNTIRATVAYVRARLDERGTWAGLGAAMTVALTTIAAISGAPHNLIVGLSYGIAVCGVVAVLVPGQ